MPNMIRPAWRGDESQEQLLSDAVTAVQSARASEDAAWIKMQRAREAGVPDTVLCSRAEVSRATLNRKLGARPPGGQLVDFDPKGDHVPDDATKPEPSPVVAAIVTSGRGVLVGRRNDGIPPWGFITGKIEPGESQADAAVREVKEETGLVIEPAPYEIGRRVHPKTGRTMIYLACTPTGKLDAIVGDEEELAEVRWVGLAEADELLPGMFEPVHDYLVREI